MKHALIWTWLLFLVCALLLKEPGSAEASIPGPSLDACKPVNGISKQECQKLVKLGCSQLLNWVGLGCIDQRGKRLQDGGCQSLADGKYCKWRCRSRCVDNGFCMWIPDKGCRYRGCGGIDLFDRSPSGDFPRGGAGLSSIRTNNWAADGIGLRVPLAQNTLCGVQLYIISSRDPDTSQLGQVELKVYSQRPQSFADAPLTTVQVYLVKALARGRLGDTALKWFSLRYELSEHVPVMPTAGPADILLRFPFWKDFAFSLLSSSLPNNETLPCSYSLGNVTKEPISACNVVQKDSQVFLKVFA